MQITLKDLDDLKKHLEHAIGAKIDTALEEVKKVSTKFDARVTKLEKTQGKAVAVYTLIVGAISTGGTFFYYWLLGWLRTHTP